MYQFLLSTQVREWLAGLRDLRGKALVLNRIRVPEGGNFGDCAPVGGGVSEMRIHHGYLVLVAGSKGSQKRDIKTAIALAERIGKEPR
jgi:putative component of toxin-antitoxin plasmid stabilization module